MVSNAGKELASIIKHRRISSLLTIEELGALSGVSLSHLSKIENGKRLPSTHILQKIARTLSFEATKLSMLAGFLSHGAPIRIEGNKRYPYSGRLDPL